MCNKGVNDATEEMKKQPERERTKEADWLLVKRLSQLKSTQQVNEGN